MEIYNCKSRFLGLPREDPESVQDKSMGYMPNGALSCILLRISINSSAQERRCHDTRIKPQPAVGLVSRVPRKIGRTMRRGGRGHKRPSVSAGRGCVGESE